MENQQIIQLIRTDNFEKAFAKLYQNYHSVQKFITLNNGSEEEAKDVFQEALYILYITISKPDFSLTSSINTYLIAICKNLWFENLRKKKMIVKIEESSDLEIREVIQEEEKFKKLDLILQQIGEKCLKILKLYYYEKKTMEEIASSLNFQNEHVARTQKYKCMEKAREMAKKGSLTISIADIF